MTDAELIRKICEQAPEGKLVEHLATTLSLVRELKTARIKYMAYRQKIKDRHRAEMEEFDRQYRVDMERCTHLDTTYHGDPSGGSDSFTTCNICGKQW